MICPHCKRKFTNSTNICPRCGRNLSEYRQRSAEHAARMKQREAMRARQEKTAAKTPQSAASHEKGSRPASRNIAITAEFGYPFRDTGKYILFFCFFISAGAKIAGFALPVWGAIFSMTAQAITFIYFLDIIDSSSAGRPSPPDIPSVENIGDIVTGFVAFFVIDTIAAGPSFLFKYFATKAGIAPPVVTGGWMFLRLLGIFYFPMACMYVSQNRTLAALDPVPVVKSALSAPTAYYTICFCMFIVLVPGLIVTTISAFIPSRLEYLQYGLPMLFEILKIYVMFLLGRAMGLFLAG